MTTTVESLTKLIETNLSDFINQALEKRKLQIAETIEYVYAKLKTVPKKEDYPESWFFSEFGHYSLTRAGYAGLQKLRRPIEKQLEEYRAAMIANIVKALYKYEATELTPKEVRIGNLGLEGWYGIGQGRSIELKAVMAGGYNIQCLHYRYTVRQY